jgi:hypothetical protein
MLTKVNETTNPYVNRLTKTHANKLGHNSDPTSIFLSGHPVWSGGWTARNAERETRLRPLVGNKLGHAGKVGCRPDAAS